MSNLGNRASGLGAGTRARQGHRMAVIDEPPQKVDNKVIVVAEARITKSAKTASKTKKKIK